MAYINNVLLDSYRCVKRIIKGIVNCFKINKPFKTLPLLLYENTALSECFNCHPIFASCYICHSILCIDHANQRRAVTLT